MKRRTNNGFTLVELVCCLTVLSSVAAVATPRMMRASTQVKMAAMNHLAGTLHTAVAAVAAQRAVQGSNTLTMPNGGRVEFSGSVPTVGTVGNLIYGIGQTNPTDNTTNGRQSTIQMHVTGNQAVFCIGESSCTSSKNLCSVQYTVDSPAPDGFYINRNQITLALCGG
jgi:prepilin-type N-terminal cleavage/methylation domain-containing protein